MYQKARIEVDSQTAIRLSPQQQHVWNLMESSSRNPYFARCRLAMHGEWDQTRLAAAIQSCVDRYEILRTNFQAGRQIVRPAMDAVLHVVTAETAGSDQAPIFDLENGASLHAELVVGPDGQKALNLTLTAMCADARTLDNVAASIIEIYSTTETSEPLINDPIQYRLIVDWEYALLEEEEARVGIAYWREKLVSEHPPASLPGEKSKAHGSFQPESVGQKLDAALINRVQALAMREGVSVQEALLACWLTLLGRLSGGTIETVATTFDGRTDSDLKDAIGLFAHVVPIRIQFDSERTVGATLRETAKAVYEAASWQECFSWDEVKSVFGHANEEPFLPFAFEFVEPAPNLTAGNLSFTCEYKYVCLDRFHLRLRCEPGEIHIDFDSNRYFRSRVERLLKQFLGLLRAAGENPSARIGSLNVLDDEEYWEILFKFNQTSQSFDGQGHLPDLIARQAAESPDRIAVVMGHEAMSFAELETRSNRLAHHLRRYGVGPEQFVGIVAQRSIEMVIGLVGILKSGAAYLPLDPLSPPERLQSLLTDAQPAVVLTQESHGAEFPKTLTKESDAPVPVLCLNQDWHQVMREPATPPRTAVSPDNPAYVMFTSGSTGRPKGVVIPHRALRNHMLWMLREFPMGSTDRIMQRTPILFDASVWEVFAPLMAGAQLVLPAPEADFDVALLMEEAAKREVTVLQVVPALLRMITNSSDPSAWACLKLLFCGGETLTHDLKERCVQALKICPINLYGPTETCIDACWSIDGEAHQAAVPIGRPIANLQAYVLDQEGQLCGLEIAGELYLGGEGLARGYLRRPDLTAANFCPHQWSTTVGERLYRSGDLAAWLPDGKLQFIGRRDEQIKVRGVRIELNEIRAALMTHSTVKDCVVLAREGLRRQKEIVAFVEIDDAIETPQSQLQTEWLLHLRALLPDVMIPSEVVVMAKLPRTSSGKIDRQILHNVTRTRQFVAPRTPTEQEVAAVWGEVLSLDAVSIDDNFFSLGGHSLLLTKVVTRLQKTFKIDLSLRSLFDTPTVAGLAAVIDVLRATNRKFIEVDDDGSRVSSLVKGGNVRD
jgi:amino acid adenylation domain-containing protein